MRLSQFLFIVIFAIGIFSMSIHVEAQEPGKVARIGIMGQGGRAYLKNPFYSFFLKGLGDLGWVEGRNFEILFRGANWKLNRLPDVAAELVGLNVDVIFSPTTICTRAAVDATQIIPIVFVHVSDPIRSGFVASFARPGGNVTGVTSVWAEMAGKRLQLLQEAMPDVSRVAVLWNTAHKGKVLEFNDLQAVAPNLGVILQSVEVQNVEDFGPAFSAMKREDAEALIVLVDPLTHKNGRQIMDLALKNRMPSISTASRHVNDGGLMVYSTNMPRQYRRAAAYVDKILKGAKPADLPVERPMEFEFVINLKTAKTLGITIPDSLLMRADRVIE